MLGPERRGAGLAKYGSHLNTPSSTRTLYAAPVDDHFAERARALLRDVFGHADFRGPQADIVGHVAAGGDALVL
ncbi:MAG: hypothetical protein ACM3JC_02825, partial [Rudaea sp.]